MKKQVASTADFEVKANGDAVFIEGFANKNVVDRGKERIATDAWDLENFKKNPVILFNHGMDPVLGGTPVGKAVAVTPTDDGLRMKVRMSNSKSPLITMIRDLVEEGILKTFSVGFETKDHAVERDEKSDQDVRVIKQAELFETSIVGIPMNQDSVFDVTGKMLKTKKLDEIEAMVCERKGALVAGAVHTDMFKKLSDGEFDRDQAFTDISEKAEIEVSELKEILAGDVTPVPEPVLEAVSEVLGMDLEQLQRLNAGDVESKEMDKDKEDDDEDKDKEKDEKQTTLDDSVKAKISELIAEGVEQADAVAKAFSECLEEMGLTDEIPKEKFKEMLEYADGLVESKQADQDESGEDPAPSTPIMTAPPEDQFGSPYLESMKQTNVLLGVLVSEMQKQTEAIIKALNNGNTNISAESEAFESDETTDDVKAAVDNYKKRLENISQRIKKLVN